MSLTYAGKVAKALAPIYNVLVEKVRVRGGVTCLKSVTSPDKNSGTCSMLFLLALSSKLSTCFKVFFFNCKCIGRELKMFEVAVTWSVCFMLSTEVDTKK